MSCDADFAWIRDLRSVTVHEYAHLHVARHFGVWGWVSIHPGRASTFAGQFTAEPIDDAHAKRIVALAGSCAEALDRDPRLTPASLLALEEFRLSPTDAAMAAGFDAAHVDECLGILRASWPAIVRDAHGAVELELREAQRRS